MALTPQQLADSSRCFDCIPKGMRDAVIIYLLNQLANMASPQELVTAARCYDCIPTGMRSAVITYLQDAILAGGGEVGATEVFLVANGDNPVEAPTNPAVAYTLAGDFWTYDEATNNWIKIISA